MSLYFQHSLERKNRFILDFLKFKGVFAVDRWKWVMKEREIENYVGYKILWINNEIKSNRQSSQTLITYINMHANVH